jgi:hypothetical protein
MADSEKDQEDQRESALMNITRFCDPVHRGPNQAADISSPASSPYL